MCDPSVAEVLGVVEHSMPGPRSDLGEQFAILTVVKERMNTPWTGEKFDRVRIAAIRSAFRADMEPEENERWRYIDAFPFRDAHVVEITPDNRYYSDAPRVSALKRAEIMAKLVGKKFSTTWNASYLFDHELHARHPSAAPHYAAVMVEVASHADLIRN